MSRSAKLYVVGLLLITVLRPLQGQSVALDLQIPVVDRLPKWYYEQAPNQAVGISLSVFPKITEADYEQAICFALIRAALSQSDPSIIKGKVASMSATNDDIRQDILTISAELQTPSYIVIEQCRLKDGPLLVLIQYQYRDRNTSEILKIEFSNLIDNSEYENILIAYGDYAFRSKIDITDDAMYKEVYFSTPTETRLMSNCSLRQYSGVMRNRYLLQRKDYQIYLGPLCFDDLRQELYRKLWYRQYDKE